MGILSLTKHNPMRISLATAVLLFTLLQPAVEAIFLGPIAVGVALGAIAVTKGLILGSILSRSRTSHRNGRSYTSYNRRSHYSQPKTYYSHYTKPKVYYYSSNSYSHGHHHGKRSVPEFSEEQLSRMIREVQQSVMTDEWYMDMVEKDQDDCTKRLICEISYKKENGERLGPVEKEIVGIFGVGRSVDTSKSTAIFDFAALAGKYWNRGGIGCDFFKRCDTPINDIVAMIENELEDFRELEESFFNDKIKAETAMKDETNEVEKMVNSL